MGLGYDAPYSEWHGHYGCAPTHNSKELGNAQTRNESATNVGSSELSVGDRVLVGGCG